jgi:hypothetical protein
MESTTVFGFRAVLDSSVAGPDDMRRKVISHLKFLQRNPVLIQSFFQAPTTAYAA